MTFKQTWEWDKRKLPCKIRVETQDKNVETDNLRTQLIQIIEKLATGDPIEIDQNGLFPLQVSRKQQSQKEGRMKYSKNNAKKNSFDNQSISSSTTIYDNGNTSNNGVKSNKFLRHNSSCSLKKHVMNSIASKSSTMQKSCDSHKSLSSILFSSTIQASNENINDKSVSLTALDDKLTKLKKKKRAKFEKKISKSSEPTTLCYSEISNHESSGTSNNVHACFLQNEQLNTRSITEENNYYHLQTHEKNNKIIKKQDDAQNKKSLSGNITPHTSITELYKNKIKSRNNCVVNTSCSLCGEARKLNLFG